MVKMEVLEASKWQDWFHVNSEWQENPEIFTLCFAAHQHTRVEKTQCWKYTDFFSQIKELLSNMIYFSLSK